MRSLFARLALPCVGFLLTIASAYALPDSTGVADSTGSFETVLYIGHFDFDCVPDTLIGFARSPSFQVLPRRIVWGVDSALDCGTLSAHQDVSHFVYPDWEELSGSVTIVEYNRQDSLPDIIFFYGGKIDTGANRRDTAIFLALFGQDSIAAIDSIPLFPADTLQESPFFSLMVIPESRLLDSGLVDYSGYPSYELPPVLLDVTGDTTSTSIVLLSSVKSVATEQKLLSEIYPNPVSALTTIRVRPLPPGTYRIEVTASNGSSVIGRNIEVRSSQELFEPLDFSALPGGYYRVSVRSRDRVLTSHSIAVVK